MAKKKGFGMIVLILIVIGLFWFMQKPEEKKEAVATVVFSKTNVLKGETFSVTYSQPTAGWSLKVNPPFGPNEPVTFSGDFYREYVAGTSITYTHTAPQTIGNYRFTIMSTISPEGWLTQYKYVDVVDCIPSSETCDNIDNNCDGSIDNGINPQSQSCGTDTGECVAGTKTRTCSAGAWGAWSTCSGVQATTETCGDGIDQDCNGADLSGNTPADTNCNGCIEDIGEWGNAVVNWKSQTGGINDDNWINIVPKWKTQEGC